MQPPVWVEYINCFNPVTSLHPLLLLFPHHRISFATTYHPILLPDSISYTHYDCQSPGIARYRLYGSDVCVHCPPTCPIYTTRSQGCCKTIPRYCVRRDSSVHSIVVYRYVMCSPLSDLSHYTDIDTLISVPQDPVAYKYTGMCRRPSDFSAADTDDLISVLQDFRATQ